MKSMKIFLRYWFAITSVLSFVGGWIIFAHSPKPIQPTKANNSPAPLPNQSPIQTFGVPNSNSNNGFGIFSPQNNTQQGFGFSIRTGGS